jgi:hypothetical protein
MAYKKLIFILLILMPLSVSAVFSRDLYLGLRNDPDVSRLQQFLRGQGHFTFPEITGNFFGVTRAAVAKFQKANNIAPAAGYFGPLTRSVANKLFGDATTPVAVISSSAKGKIKISDVSGTSETPQFESITIQNTGEKENISITGFTISSDKSSFVIPQGHHLLGSSASAEDPILLKPGERATIAVGKQAKLMDFRENLCTGYYSEFSDFAPSLSHSCPRPDTRELLHLSDRCINVIERTSTCRTADLQDTFIESACSEYINQNLNYAGCVRNYQSRSDFFSGQWLIWMQRKEEFFRNTHDKIILKDTQGRVVDEYSY